VAKGRIASVYPPIGTDYGKAVILIIFVKATKKRPVVIESYRETDANYECFDA